MVEKKERTEDEVIAQAPIEVILGGRKYQVKPLVIRDSREWRKEAGAFQASISRYASIDSDNPEEFEKALTELLISRIDTAIDLFFKYAKDLDREKIEGEATEAEVAKAFEAICKVAFPFE